ncbi:MAG: MarR family transcriptional regulator [Candidatus Sumerlaeia bacterium]|nr:MarR family transcriptional regulator [Candidatus Sumerlaeia bacterium]
MTPIKDEIQQNKPFESPGEEALIALLRTADHLNLVLERMMKDHGITPTQYNVMRILRGSLPGGLPCSEIGKRLVNHVPDVTRLLDRIERAGWATRERTTEDRRLVIIRLTPEGKAKVDAMEEPVNETQRGIMGCLNDDEISVLIDMLDRIRNGTV